MQIPNDYQKKLEKLYGKIIKNIHLTEKERSEGLKIVEKYYSFLQNEKIEYARIALEVAINQGDWGQLANIHLRHQAIFDGIPASKVDSVRDKMIIRLAHRDLQMRLENPENEYAAIDAYHKAEFKAQISEYAWAGLLFSEVKDGAWMDAYQDNSMVQSVYDLAKGVFSSEFKTNYSIDRMCKSLIHTHSIYTTYADNEFTGKIRLYDKKHAATTWGVDESRIIEIPSIDEDDIGKVFKVLPEDSSKYTNSDVDIEEADDCTPPEHLVQGLKAANEFMARQCAGDFNYDPSMQQQHKSMFASFASARNSEEFKQGQELAEKLSEESDAHTANFQQQHGNWINSMMPNSSNPYFTQGQELAQKLAAEFQAATFMQNMGAGSNPMQGGYQQFGTEMMGASPSTDTHHVGCIEELD